MRTAPLLVLLVPSAVHAATLSVGPTRAYTTISSAITAAASGDTIAIDADTYDEDLILTKSLTLIGAGSGNTIVRNDGSASTIDISGSIVVSLSGMTVQGWDSDERGIDIDTATVAIDDLEIVDNTADGRDGAGMRVQSGAIVTVTSSIFDTNGSNDGDGGQIWVDGATVSLSDTELVDGWADAGHGGGIYAHDAALSIDASWIEANFAGGGWSGLGDGGGIYLTGGSVATIAGTTFFQNEAEDDGGGLYAAGSTVAIDGSTFDDNLGNDTGGGARFSDATIATVSSTTFSANTATYGGGLYASTATTMVGLDAVTFDANVIFSWWTIGYGAAAVIDNATVTSTASTLTSHVSTVPQPTVYLSSAGVWDGVGDVVTSNTSSSLLGTGGAFYLTGTARAAFSGATFTSNRAASGGAIYVASSGNLSIDTSTFTSNNASGTAGVGGAIAFAPSSGTATLTLDGNAFATNTTSGANADGGAVYASNGLVVSTDTWYTDNRSPDGGALYLTSGADGLRFTNNVLCANDATAGDGGGAYVDLTASGAALTWTNNVVAENTATSEGGGIYFTTSSARTASVVNNTFLGNRATTQGGSVYFGTSSTNFSFVNNIVSTTGAGNGASTGTTAPTTRTLQYSDWFTNTTTNLGGGISTVTLDTTNIASDPQLASWTADGDCTNDVFWPEYGSPVVDAGDPTLLDPDGSVSDIGAFGGAAADASLFVDADADGYVAMFDCDDTNAAINKGAVEVCDGIDNDCDGAVDEADAIDAATWYADADVDAYGNAAVSTKACAMPTGYVADSTDCDDAVAAVNPGAAETCNGRDDDCDGSIDESAVDMTTWYSDLDSDGYGFDGLTAIACDAPTDYVAVGGDCNDFDAAISPAAVEVCDGVDNDCDGTTDLGVLGSTTYYADADGDGYGDGGVSVSACSAPTGYVAVSGDCNDSNAATYPGASEYCDGADNDCDGAIDEAAVDASTWYADGDGDGYGDLSTSTAACSAPLGYVSDATDCNDLNSRVSPAGVEICDGLDNDCDGAVDDSPTDATTWYADADGDGLGDAAVTVSSCSAPAGYVATGTDCDDTNAAVTGGLTYYVDGDGDGYGGTSGTIEACSLPSGYAANSIDCDDATGATNPGATEYCDAADNDCDGAIDENDAADAATWYLDADTDGWGDAASSVVSCYAASGYVGEAGDCNDADALYHPFADESCADLVDYNCDGSVGTADADADGVQACDDCDDSDPAVFPGAAEMCDALDNDCDGSVDEADAVDAVIWYVDVDADGFGDALGSVVACDGPTGYVSDSTDCNDADALSFPGATETCSDTVDYNCDGSFGSDDVDADGWIACEDCDDADATVNPAADDLCNDVDDDCDGEVDEDGALYGTTWYADGDGDGHGLASAELVDCVAPEGYTDSSDDCDDGDAQAYPGAEEIWYDGVDQACDGGDDFDQDGDTFASDDFAGDDCDDLDPAVNPAAADQPGDGVDADCDGDDEAPGDTDQPTGDTGDGEYTGRACKGCDAGSASTPTWALLLAAVGLARRRRSA